MDMARDVIEELLPVAVLTSEDGGAELVLVEEVDGALVERGSGRPVDLVSLVVVLGLPELERAA